MRRRPPVTNLPGPPPACAVARILEITGPKGGTIHVLLLRCGSWVTRRLRPGSPPPVKVSCIGCHIRRQLPAGQLGRPPVRMH
jgi:hypothetical protein